MIELKEEFLSNMKELLKDDFGEFLAIYDKPFIKGLRVNTTKISLSAFSKLFLAMQDKIPYANAFYLSEGDKLGPSPYHHAGLFYIQEPSAMQPALSTQIAPDSVVLDLCASPGGKSGQIAEMLNESGLLVSNEIITARAKILKENMDRLGYKNVIVTSTTPQNLTRLGNIFDIIILDAPCSGEGLFRREPEAMAQWNKGINKMNSERQLELLRLATNLLKPSGKIIYSTCTFSKTENEDVVAQFLQTHPNFTLGEINPALLPYSFSLETQTTQNEENETNQSPNSQIDLNKNQINLNAQTQSGEQTTNLQEINQNDLNKLKSNLKDEFNKNQFNPQNLRRVMPHKNKGEGQFYAVLHSTEEPQIDNKKYDYLEPPKASEKQIVADFIRKHTNLTNLKIKSYEGNILCPPQKEINTKSIFVLKYGINLGKIENKRFIPNHNFFTTLGNQFKIIINLTTEEEVQKYLKGEQLETANTALSGYCTIAYNNFPLGGGKVSNGKINNLYPKYLRTP